MEGEYKTSLINLKLNVERKLNVSKFVTETRLKKWLKLP